jgi:hypothetical protein
MVDRRGFHLAGVGGGGEQEHCEAVGSTGDGEAEPRTRPYQRVEIGSETVNECGVRDHI